PLVYLSESPECSGHQGLGQLLLDGLFGKQRRSTLLRETFGSADSLIYGSNLCLFIINSHVFCFVNYFVFMTKLVYSYFS
ncbi:hypothetical protein, partial [Aeromonas sp. R1-1]|uniref:hypothetical protein n=1 Tax=Aeromonas sp. R1-1 TaxID=3138455 RepID=UPI0034A2062B